MKRAVFFVVLVGAALGYAAGGLDLGLGRDLNAAGFAGRLGFYLEGSPLAVRGDLILGERGGLLGEVDLLWRPRGDRFVEPYLGLGASTLIARLAPEGGLVMDVGAESFAVATAGLALRFARARPYVDVSYSYGPDPYARAGFGIVWRW